jgi:PhzF family phenazine biosynthesis protein
MSSDSLLRLSAFSDNGRGGNPAGVWIGDMLPDPATMQRIAAEVGYSETAFVAPSTGPIRQVRYYSPEAEVSFCGHATIAAGVALGNRHGSGDFRFDTAIGPVPVTVRGESGHLEATLQSVDTLHEPADPALLAEVLGCLHWAQEDLDASIPAVKAYAGAWHLVLAVRSRDRLASLDYDFDGLKALMLRAGLTTLQLVWRERQDLFHSRNPFPVGGVVEDPATGAAAAALGGYLRDSGLVEVPTHFVIRQGEDMGRPSRLLVDVPVQGGVQVTGTAIEI